MTKLDEIKQRYDDCRELQYINLKLADPAKSHISAEVDMEWLIDEVERLQTERGAMLFELQGLTAEKERLRAIADEAITRLTVLGEAFDDDCRLDHHGFCQAHLVTKPCEIAETRKFLDKAKPR